MEVFGNAYEMGGGDIHMILWLLLALNSSMDKEEELLWSLANDTEFNILDQLLLMQTLEKFGLVEMVFGKVLLAIQW